MTYQHLVNMMFKEQIGKTMEVHMDDILVKSRTAVEKVSDEAEYVKVCIWGSI